MKITVHLVSFKNDLKNSTEAILKDSNLINFIKKIETNYSKNLEDNKYNIEFSFLTKATSSKPYPIALRCILLDDYILLKVFPYGI